MQKCGKFVETIEIAWGWLDIGPATEMTNLVLN